MLAVQLALVPFIILTYKRSKEYITKPKLTVAVACCVICISLISIYSSAQLSWQEHDLGFLLDIHFIPFMLYFMLGIWLIRMVIKNKQN